MVTEDQPSRVESRPRGLGSMWDGGRGPEESRGHGDRGKEERVHGVVAGYSSWGKMTELETVLTALGPAAIRSISLLAPLRKALFCPRFRRAGGDG